MAKSNGVNSENAAKPDHDYFMGLALREARRGYMQLEVPVGAVIIDGHGTMLGKACNSPIRMHDPTAHAEILALRQASRKLKNYRLPGTILYVTLEPCAMCLGAMLLARIEKLVFGAADPKSGAAKSVVDLTNVSGFNHYIEVVDGVRAGECADLLRRFFKQRRDKNRT
ncbi:MAG: tRNA adenosine(34) deaminase TadA [Desulfoferrobacter sp.]